LTQASRIERDAATLSLLDAEPGAVTGTSRGVS
jgi:hypothetical protein